MTQLEKEIEQKLVKTVKAHGGYCLKWVCPGWSGMPDRIILLPGARVIFCEVKRPKGGRLSALQKKWREWLTAIGFEHFTLWTLEELLIFEQRIQGEKENAKN